ncbi:thiol:disulfide interchange protein DsbA/DsbL [Inhella sp.]|uniref:thiol:disulfide interchange protein DsbA/DsbL n=1 Tax=Inhella sp. TaxID=1921806 RepID=UPI0035B3F174
MTLTRRSALLAPALPLLLPQSAAAQTGFQEGKHYTRIQPAVPGTAGKVEVVEFFWYGCPACYAFETAIQAWAQRLPAWVAFRHQHVFFREQTRPHQRLWFTLQAMGVEHRFRSAIFAAMHAQRNPLDTPEAMIKLLQPAGLDVARFQSVWASFDPKAFSGARIAAANRQAAEQYKVSGVPALAVGGRYIFTVAEAADRRQESPVGASALRLADQLLNSLKPA